MKKRFIATVLSLVLTMSMSVTALAASSTTSGNSSSSTSSNSSSSEESSSSSSTTTASKPAVATPSNPKPVATVVAETKAGATIAPAAIQVAIASPSGTVAPVTLDKVVATKQQEVVQAVASIAAIAANIAPTASAADQTQAATQIVAQVSALLTKAPSPVFQQTVEHLASTKGADIAVNNCGTVKTAAVASDALGNNIASAGIVKNVTSGALIMLMSVNADGTIEYVEGIVDPVTGAVLGAFQGVPSVITVLVLA